MELSSTGNTIYHNRRRKLLIVEPIIKQNGAVNLRKWSCQLYEMELSSAVAKRKASEC